MAKGEREGNRLAARSPQRPRFGPWEWGVLIGAILFAIYLPLALGPLNTAARNTLDSLAGLLMTLTACGVMLAAARHVKPVAERLAGAWLLLGLAYASYSLGECSSLLGVSYGQGA